MSDGNVHQYFSAYGTVVEAFVRLHTALYDLKRRAEEAPTQHKRSPHPGGKPPTLSQAWERWRASASRVRASLQTASKL